jgi:hypothetical protein
MKAEMRLFIKETPGGVEKSLVLYDEVNKVHGMKSLKSIFHLA